MARGRPRIDLGGDEVPDMRLRPQKPCKDSAVSGIREDDGHNQRDQERCGPIQHYSDYTIEAHRVPGSGRPG
jgi:hypothetical protein